MGRPLADRETIYRLAKACGDRFRALVLMLYCSGLTWSEAIALTLRRCDPAGTFVDVLDVGIETPDGVQFKAKKRGYSALCTIESPASQWLAKHLFDMEDQPRHALVFTDDRGAALRRTWFDEHVWRPALAAVGLPDDVSLDELATERLRAAWADKALGEATVGEAPLEEQEPAAGQSPEEAEAFWPTEAAYAGTVPLTGWREWDSVYYVLTAPCIARDSAPFIDVRRQSVNWTGLRRAGRVWGHGARLLLALAHNLWNSTGQPSVREMVDTLDEENFARALRAIQIARGIPALAGNVGQSL